MVNNTKKIVVSAMVLAVVALSFATAIPSSNAASSSGPSGEFIFGTPISTTVGNLNPLTVSNSLGSIISQEVYADSLGFQWSDGSFTPWLASSWTTSYSGVNENITFTINSAANWMNGTSVMGPITGKDVAYTFNAILGNSSLDGYDLSTHLTKVVSYDNNSKVSFDFNSTSALWFTYVASQTIIPSSWAQYDNGTPGNIGSFTNMGPYSSDITAGPFTLTNISAEGATLTANTHFWMGSPHIKTFFIEDFKSTSAATLSLENGAIAGVFPALSDYNALQSVANITSVNQPEPWTFYLWMNDTYSYFANAHFRQGMAYSINKTQIMQKAEDGLGSWGANMSYGGLPYVLKSWWASGLTQYNVNTTKALAAFNAAGYNLTATSSGPELVNNSTGKQVTVTIVEPPVADWQAAGTFIQADLKAVGIKVTLLSVPFSTWSSDVFGTNVTDLTYFGYVPSYTNPYIQLQGPYDYNSGFWNVGGFSNSSLNKLFNTTISATGSQYATNLDAMQKIIDYQIPAIPIGNANNFYAYNNKMVQGFLPNLTMKNPYNLMQITSSYTPATTSTGSPAAGNSNMLYYAIGGVVVAAIVGIGVGLALRGGKGKQEK